MNGGAAHVDGCTVDRTAARRAGGVGELTSTISGPHGAVSHEQALQVICGWTGGVDVPPTQTRTGNSAGQVTVSSAPT